MVARSARSATGKPSGGPTAPGRVVANSIPKSGTHLLLRLLTLLGYEHVQRGARRHMVSGRFPLARRLMRTGGGETVPVGIDAPERVSRRWLERRLSKLPDHSAVSAHCSYSEGFAGIARSQDLKVVCIVRDPRDTAVSHMHNMRRNENHFLHEGYASLADDHARLMFSIRGGRLGDHHLRPLDERYRDFLRWDEDERAVLVRFEDLVGPEGGGSEERQLAAISRVTGHLGVALGPEDARSVGRDLFGSGRTFRKGRSGGWREEFSPEHREEIKEQAQDLLVELGYEKDDRW